MITLPNGDKWRLLTVNDPTLQTPGSHLPENTVPTSFEEFVDALRLDMDERKSKSVLIPARWDASKQLWEFMEDNVFDECFMLIATKAANLPFGIKVFLMPWGKVYVVYGNCAPYLNDFYYCMTHFDSWDDYVASVTNIADLPQD